MLDLETVHLPKGRADTNSFDTSCRGFPFRFHSEMIGQTRPNAYLGDSTIRLELLRGIPANCVVSEAPSVGWWLSTRDCNKILLVDPENYSSAYSNPRQTQRVFKAVMESDHALFLCHEGGNHFMAGCIVRPREALRRKEQRQFQSLVVVMDTLQATASAISPGPSRRLLDGLQTVLDAGRAEAEFTVLNVLGPRQRSRSTSLGAGADCGIFSYLALLRFLDRPNIFDLNPGQQSLSKATEDHIQSWITNEETGEIRLRLHREYQLFWQHRPSVIWSSKPGEDLSRLLREDNRWPLVLPSLLSLLPSNSSRNNLVTIFGATGGYFTPSALAAFLVTGSEVSDAFVNVLLRRHPRFPDQITAAPQLDRGGDYNLQSHSAYQSGQPQLLFEEDRDDLLQRIIRAVTDKTQILFIPIFDVRGQHFWSVWLDLQRQIMFFSDSVNNRDRSEDVQVIRAELARLLPRSLVETFRQSNLQTWPIEQVPVTRQVSSECFVCVAQLFRSLSVPFRPSPPGSLTHNAGWDGQVRQQWVKELFSF